MAPIRSVILTLTFVVSSTIEAQQVVQNGIPIGADTHQVTSKVINVAAGGDVVSAVAAAANAGGGTVNLAAGVYNITNSINLGSNVTIKGHGADTVVYAPRSPNSIAMIAAANGAVSNVIIEDLVLDGNIPQGAFMATGTSGINPYENSGVYVYGNNNAVDNIQLTHVEIRNTGIGILMTVTNGITLNDVYVHDNNPGNFAHNAYLVGCDFVYIVHSRFMHAHTGDGLHFDFSASYYEISKSEFSNNHGEGVLDQGAGSINIQDSVFNGNVNDGLNASSSGEVLTRSIANFNAGYGFNIQGSEYSVDLSGDGDGGGIGWFNWASGAFVNLLTNTTPNRYLALLATGVTGRTDTADWVTSTSGYKGGALSGYSSIGAVDFNVHHLANGLLTFPDVGVVGSGRYPLIWAYSNGTDSSLRMPLTVNGKSAGTLDFPPTGGWSHWSSVSIDADLEDGPNVVSVKPLSTGAPLLDYLQVSTSVPPPPATPTGVVVEATGPYSTHLTWTRVRGASGYTVFRSAGHTTAATVIAAGVTDTNYADTDILFGASTYSYSVQAINQGGGSGLSASVVVATPIDAPAGLQVNAQPGGNALNWMSASGATAYHVLRSHVSGGPYTVIATVINTTNLYSSNYSEKYTDTKATPNQVVYYVVEAVDARGTSEHSYQVSAQTAPARDTFVLRSAAPSMTLSPNTGSSVGIIVNDGNGFSGTVNFSLTGFPGFGSYAFVPKSSASGTELIIFVPTSAKPGKYALTVKGVSGKLSAQVPIELIVPAS